MQSQFSIYSLFNFESDICSLDDKMLWKFSEKFHERRVFAYRIELHILYSTCQQTGSIFYKLFHHFCVVIMMWMMIYYTVCLILPCFRSCNITFLASTHRLAFTIYHNNEGFHVWDKLHTKAAAAVRN